MAGRSQGDQPRTARDARACRAGRRTARDPVETEKRYHGARHAAVEWRMTRVLLADDHALVRAGLRSVLQGLPDIEVVGEAGDGNEAVALAAELKPDLVLMDVSMPQLNGLEATRRVLKLRPPPRVL